MNIDDIRQVISAGESASLEFKRSTAQLKSAMETLCAFLNGDGGLIFFGVTDQKRLIGQDVADKTKREIGNAIMKISPSPMPPIQTAYIDMDNGKQIILIKATANPELRPYTYDGKAFIRIESNTMQMPREHYHHYIEYNSNKVKWEDGIAANVSIDDLDHNEILRTVQMGIANKRIPADINSTDVANILQHFEMMFDGKLTNAAVVLFGKRPQTWFPQCLIRLARFRGTDRLADFIDNKQFSGNIFQTIEEAMVFANRYLPIASTFPEGSIERKDEPLFSQKLLREVFANAVCHRDFKTPGGSISLAIYDDRLEVWNSGLLPNGVSIDGLAELHRSVPRNPKIAKVLYYRQVIEHWGRGIELIINECKKSGHPAPIFKQDPVGVSVTLVSKEPLGASGLKSDDALRKLTALQREIYSIIQQKSEVTLRDIANALKEAPTERTIQNNLAALKKLNFIDHVGHGRSARWILKS